MMDRVIQKKWIGKFDINSSILDYSTPQILMRDKHGLFATDRIFSELKLHILNSNWSERTHNYKFYVWQNSMQFRF